MDPEFKVVMASHFDFYKVPQGEKFSGEVIAHRMTSRTADELLSILRNYSPLRLD